MSAATIKLQGVHAVVFDLDDTLYCERDFAFSGFDAVEAWLRDRFPCPFPPAGRMRSLFDAGERGHIFDRILAELGQPVRPELIADMVSCYRLHVPSIRFQPDAEQALAKWRSGFRLGLISDGPLETQRLKVEALGLAGRVEHIILTDQWGRQYWKPHPRSFEEMERRLGATGGACVYIGDNPLKDFIAPNQRGWRTVRLRRAEGIYADEKPPVGGEPQHLIGKLGDLELTPRNP